MSPKSLRSLIINNFRSVIFLVVIFRVFSFFYAVWVWAISSLPSEEAWVLNGFFILSFKGVLLVQARSQSTCINTSPLSFCQLWFLALDVVCLSVLTLHSLACGVCGGEGLGSGSVLWMLKYGFVQVDFCVNKKLQRERELGLV